MALDTEDKRASVGAVGPVPWLFQVGDGTINTGDRLQMLALYRSDGVAPSPNLTGGGFAAAAIARRRRRRW